MSGNPGGRPKVSHDFDALIKKMLRSPMEGDSEKRTWAQGLVGTLFSLGISGDIKAIKLIAERSGGLPKQTIRQEVPVSYHLTLEQIEPNSPEALAAQTPEDDDSDLEEVPTDNDEPAIGGHDA